MSRDMSEISSLVLYLVGIALILGGCFLLWGWTIFLIVAGVIAILVGLAVSN